MNVDVPNLLRALGITEFKEHRGELWARCPFPGHKDADASWSICWNPGGPRNGG